MKKEIRENIAWSCGIALLLLAAVLFMTEGNSLPLLPGLPVSPHLAAITLTVIGILLVGSSRKK